MNIFLWKVLYYWFGCTRVSCRAVFYVVFFLENSNAHVTQMHLNAEYTGLDPGNVHFRLNENNNIYLPPKERTD